jgi:putative ABC transport system permease protein
MDGDTITSVVLVTETIPEALPTFNDGVMRYGSFIRDARKSDGPAREAVISMSLAKRMANAEADSLLLGKTLVAQDRPYTIVGILNGDGTGTPRIVVPIDMAGDFGSPEAYPTFTIRAKEIEGVQPIVEQIKGWLDGRFGDSDRHFSIATSRQRVEQIAQGMLVFKLALGAIAAISLIVGGIGIMNVLLASVAERTREIGVRKAAGARKSDILIQFLAEAVSITGFGALIGTLLGLAASAAIIVGIKSFTGAPVGVAYTGLSVALAAVAAIVIGIVFGMFPALRASRLSPVDAIRHE